MLKSPRANTLADGLIRISSMLEKNSIKNHAKTQWLSTEEKEVRHN